MIAPCRHLCGHAARSCSFGVTESNAPMKPPIRGVHHVSSRDRVRIRDRFAFASVMDSRSPSSRTPNVNRVASEDRRSNPLPGLVTLIGPATIPDRASRARPLLVRWVGWIIGSNNRTLNLTKLYPVIHLLLTSRTIAFDVHKLGKEDIWCPRFLHDMSKNNIRHIFHWR